MASTDFLQWNPSAANQLGDAAYLSDSQRAGGAQLDQIFASPTANKALYQATTFAAAFCAMMVNKGFSPQDGAGIIGGFDALVSVLANVKTSADFEASIVTVPYATSIIFDASQSAGFDLTLTGNVVTSNLINTAVGQILTFIIQQDATGGRAFPWPGSLTAPGPVCPQPNAITIQQFIVRPSAQIVPVGPLMWITASGLMFPPNPASIVSIATSGNVSNQFAAITEKCTSAPITRSLYDARGYAGFQVTVKNLSGTINGVTVQCAVGGQTIDGFPNWPVGPFNSTTFESDGANWIVVSSATVGAQVTKQQVFTTSGTFNPSTDLLELGGWAQVTLVGGGGGSSLSNGSFSGGGGGGSVITRYVQLTGPIVVTVGAGGVPGTGTGNGGDGGTTSFGSLLTALGGKGSVFGNPKGGDSGSSLSTSGGSATGGGGGAGGCPPGGNGAASGGVGGAGLDGFGGGGGGLSSGVQNPGSNGGGASGSDAQPNTGGGAGGGTNTLGFNGGSGLVIVTWIE